MAAKVTIQVQVIGGKPHSIEVQQDVQVCSSSDAMQSIVGYVLDVDCSMLGLC